jgi:hypothetical protein
MISQPPLPSSTFVIRQTSLIETIRLESFPVDVMAMQVSLIFSDYTGGDEYTFLSCEEATATELLYSAVENVPTPVVWCGVILPTAGPPPKIKQFLFPESPTIFFANPVPRIPLLHLRFGGSPSPVLTQDLIWRVVFFHKHTNVNEFYYPFLKTPFLVKVQKDEEEENSKKRIRLL